MEDIDDLIRLDPMEQVRFEKEQNLYSIIKTVEYLVSQLVPAANLRHFCTIGICLHIWKGFGS